MRILKFQNHQGSRRRSLGYLLGVWALFIASFLHAEETPPTDFVRFVESEKGDQLQTAILTYEDLNQRRIDLIGAIHIADVKYYHALNDLFKNYEVVLYELVGGPFKKEAPQEQTDTQLENYPSFGMQVIQRFYSYLRDTLELSYQLEEVDYLAPNFVHADVTHQQFAQLQTEKNESFFTLWLRSMQANLTNPSPQIHQPGLLQILELINKPNGGVELKRHLGRMFDEVEVMISGIEAQGDTVILTERNRVLMQKLKEQLANEKSKIGIFYGSAHFMDLEKRLIALGFKKTQTRWLTAWDLPPPTSAKITPKAESP